MKKYLTSLFCGLLLCGCTSTTNNSTNLNTGDAGIPNLKVVEANIWRGGQPTTDAQWQFLKAQGITRVIKLNSDSEGSDEGATKAGLQVVSLPLSAVLAPDDRQIVTILMWFQPGTYVHCSNGQDRTGLIIGLYRYTVDGWTKTEAYKEMRANGFHPILVGLSGYWATKTADNH
jgi:protein tyrosine/serine phosphatase